MLLLNALPAATSIKCDREDAGGEVEVLTAEANDSLLVIGDVTRLDRRFQIVLDRSTLDAEVKAGVHEGMQVRNPDDIRLVAEQARWQHHGRCVRFLAPMIPNLVYLLSFRCPEYRFGETAQLLTSPYLWR